MTKIRLLAAAFAVGAVAAGSMQFGPDFVVIEYDFVMAPPKAFVMGQWRYEPSGRTYSVPAIDIITFREGLVSRKVTYLDSGVIRSNSLQAMPAVAGQ